MTAQEAFQLHIGDTVRIAIELPGPDHVGEVFMIDHTYGVCKVWLKFTHGKPVVNRKSAWVPLARCFLMFPGDRRQ